MRWINAKQILSILSLFFSLIICAHAKASLYHANDPIAGNPRGNVTVVEFFDYQCSYCIRMVPVMDAIIRANPNVRVVFKDFPIRGSMSLFAARAALAANKQGKYNAFSHALLTADQPLTETAVMTIAKRVGLNITQLKKDMRSRAITRQLNSNLKLAADLNLTGTPAFFISKTNAKNSSEINYVLGAMSQSELQAAIDMANK